MSALKKEIKLISKLNKMEKVAIAFSGGVDSTYLAAIARKTLGNNVLAITIKTEFMSNNELKNTIKLAKLLKLSHKIIFLNTLENATITENSEQRCFLCKTNMFLSLIEEADKNNITNIMEGTNIDDLKEFRPGLRALQDLKVISPLIEVELSKNEIRDLSRQLKLPTWDKPSSPCLATRIPYNSKITLEKLAQIEKAEDYISDLTINLFRVRHHGNIARIEVSIDDFSKILLNHTKIVSFFKELGFIYVTLDLQGYRSGSLNETLKRMN